VPLSGNGEVSLPNKAPVSAHKPVSLVVRPRFMQCPAPRIEGPLLLVKAPLLMPVGPVTFVLAPAIFRRGRRRLAVQRLPIPCSTSPVFCAWAGTALNASSEERDNTVKRTIT
jgi:hypothetical protein